MHENFLPIQQELPGFNPFFGSWICRDDVTLLVDPGPANTAERLVQAMEAEDIETVDYILITHIHIDHVGALSRILDRYPNAKAICHEKGIPHLVDPSRLYEGSLKVLGNLAALYGPPQPVQEDRLIPHSTCPINGLNVIETPGHAIHHLSFEFHNRLYAGEAAGNYFLIQGEEYLRPATPPRFFLDVFLKSVDRLLALKDQPIRYAHVESADKSHRLLKQFRDQLLFWEAIVRKAAEGNGNRDEIIQTSMERLLKEDPRLSAFERMDKETQDRERTFMQNSLKGFLGFFDEKGLIR